MPLNVSEHETFIAHPQSTCNDVIEFILESECVLASFVIRVFLLFNSFILRNIFNNFTLVKIQQIIVFLKSQNYLCAIFVPEHVFGGRTDIDSSHMYLAFPIVESNKLFTFDGQKPPSVNTFNCKANLEYFEFLHVFENLYLVFFTLNSKQML